MPCSASSRSQRGDQRPVLIVDRALAAEVVIVLGDLQHSLARNVLSAQHVLKERNHIVRPFRTSERDNQQSVVLHLG